MHRFIAAAVVLVTASHAWADQPPPTTTPLTPTPTPASTLGAPAAPVPIATDEPAPSSDPPAPSDQPAPTGSAAGIDHDLIEGRTFAAESLDVTSLAGSSDPRGYAKDWMVAPPGYNLGGELRFITAASSPDGPRIKFTDFALLRLHTRITMNRRIELSGSIDLLSKQPDTRHDTIAQGGGLGLKVATSRRTAVATAVSGGPTMGDDGLWGSVATGVVHRSRIEQFLAFQVGGGASALGLRQDRLDPRWQADLDFSAQLVLHAPRGELALWTGADLAFPVAHSSGLAPSSRLDVTVGTVFSAVKDWDLYAAFTIRDRGTTELPLTNVPIADGGFDQRQVIVGISRRFTARGQGTLWALATE